MSLDITHSIKRILLSEQTVSIGGLGIFYLKYHSAQIDKVNDQISPPYREISFKHKPKANSERLVESLIDEYGLDEQASKEVIVDYVTQLQDNLLEAPVDLYGLGVLKIDGNKNLLYDNESADLIFSRSDYPILHYEPLIQPYSLSPKEERHPLVITDKVLDIEEEKRHVHIQEKQVPVPAADGEVIASTPAPNVETRSRSGSWSGSWSQFLPLLFGLLILILAGWFLFRGQPISNKDVDPPITEEPNEIQETDTKSTEELSEVIENEMPTNKRSPQLCPIIVGAFGSQKNVNKLVQKIGTTTYTSFTQYLSQNGLTRVGIHVPCQEINYHLVQIQKNIEAQAWVME